MLFNDYSGKEHSTLTTRQHKLKELLLWNYIRNQNPTDEHHWLNKIDIYKSIIDNNGKPMYDDDVTSRPHEILQHEITDDVKALNKADVTESQLLIISSPKGWTLASKKELDEWLEKEMKKLKNRSIYINTIIGKYKVNGQARVGEEGRKLSEIVVTYFE